MLTIDEAIRRAWGFHETGDLSQAEALCRPILASEPANVSALYLLGRICLKTGRPDEALKLLEDARWLQPDRVEIVHHVGLSCLALGQLANAVGHFRHVLRLQPESGPAHFSLGNALKQLGQLKAAITHYRHAAQRMPNSIAAHLSLADALEQRGDLIGAAESLRECLVRFPGSPEAHYNLGNLYRKQLRPDDAIVEYRTALRLQPGMIQAHNDLGILLKSAGEVDEAISHFEQAIQLQPSYVEAYYNLGSAFRGRQEMDRATNAYEQALRFRPSYSPAYNGLAETCLEVGDSAAANAHWHAALQTNPGDYRALLGLARHDWLTPTDPGLNQIEARLREPKLSLDALSHLHFAAAYILDRAGEIDRAFEHFRQGNSARRTLFHRSGCGFNAADYTKKTQRIIDAFTPEYFRQTEGFGVSSERPIFIVGMPRSGTTLVEQILSNHSQVYGAGERKDISRIVAKLTSQSGIGPMFCEWLGGLDAAQSREIAEAHLSRLARLSPTAERVTDKMPENLFHLGLIATLFPRARVIHCRRDARDVCLSCFMQFFAGLSFAWGLDDLGRYYREYERVMAHWATALPLRVHEVVYEDLVANSDTAIRQLVDFCGLPWEDRCRQFHENRRPVLTMSRSQVRQPVYTTSVGQWQRYAAHLGPLFRALAGEPTDPGD